MYYAKQHPLPYKNLAGTHGEKTCGRI